MRLGDGTIRPGQVLEVADSCAVVQVFEGTSGIFNCKKSKAPAYAEVAELDSLQDSNGLSCPSKVTDDPVSLW